MVGVLGDEGWEGEGTRPTCRTRRMNDDDANAWKTHRPRRRDRERNCCICIGNFFVCACLFFFHFYYYYDYYLLRASLCLPRGKRLREKRRERPFLSQSLSRPSPPPSPSSFRGGKAEARGRKGGRERAWLPVTDFRSQSREREAKQSKRERARGGPASYHLNPLAPPTPLHIPAPARPVY